MKQAYQNRIVGYGDAAPDQLLANPRNARIHPKRQADALKGVLSEVGWVQDVIVNQRSGMVVDGHLRIALALRENQPTIPVKYVDLSDDEEHLILATLDPLSAAETWDKEKLDDLLRDVSTGDAAVQQLLADLAESVGIPSVQVAIAPEDDEVQVDDAGPTRVQLGETWQLGRHTVACVDSTDRAAVERLVIGKRVGMVVADPPYGIDIVAADGYIGGGAKYDYPFGGVKGFVGASTAHKARTGRYYIEETHGKRGLGTANGSKPFGSRRDHVVGTIGGDNMIAAGLYAPVIGDDSIETAINAVTLALELFENATHFWWGANNYAHVLPPSTCWIVWDKQNTGNFADAELAWSNHKSAVRIFAHMWNGLMKASERGERRAHPTQKPVALFAWLYEKYGKTDDVIFDPFLGSGPSLKAAEKLGRTVIGSELSPPYCDHILDWWERTTGETAERISETS